MKEKLRKPSKFEHLKGAQLLVCASLLSLLLIACGEESYSETSSSTSFIGIKRNSNRIVKLLHATERVFPSNSTIYTDGNKQEVCDATFTTLQPNIRISRIDQFSWGTISSPFSTAAEIQGSPSRIGSLELRLTQVNEGPPNKIFVSTENGKCQYSTDSSSNLIQLTDKTNEIPLYIAVSSR